MEYVRDFAEERRQFLRSDVEGGGGLMALD